MNCDSFEKKLDLYVENQLQKEMKKLMDEHVVQCESCRKLYEEEKELDEILNKSLSFEDVDFKSSRAEIINSIDKNRYKKGYKNNIKYHLIKNKRKYTIAASFVLMITSVALMKEHFSYFSTASKSENAVAMEKEDKSLSIIAQDKKTGAVGFGKKASSVALYDAAGANNISNILVNMSKSYSAINLIETSAENSKDALSKGKSKVKASPSGKYQTYVAGMGSDLDKEGAGILVIKDNKSNSTKYYNVSTVNAKDISPLYLEWYDDNILLIVVNGKVTGGGSVYAIDVNRGNTVLVYGSNTPLEKVTSITVSSDKIQLSLIKYTDSNMNSYTNIEKTIGLHIDQANILLSSSVKNDEYMKLMDYNSLLNEESSLSNADILAGGLKIDNLRISKSKIVSKPTYVDRIVTISDDDFSEYIKILGLSSVKVYGVESLTEDKKNSLYQMVVLGKESEATPWKIYYAYILPQGYICKYQQ
ncbi:DUF4652 domain-containing protein [Clostridium folliculivorans]|uniref:Zinc-finger domain-containing protein n=1 Tax=Clostridium folliculivorans TaxID=2886038 RepID=A0A9W5Y3S5_9CLOT|nr:DUF4652 domain-containing protein [Clostridium folliculivorans]GKU26184.1 hypothetical protein CFOLD11_30110 [Clostridium folliculivorans]GKU31856.1 hypothetical protein CFB3_39640 [Clostridium folliculivorans]